MPIRDLLQSVFNLTPSQRLGIGSNFLTSDGSLSTVTRHTGSRDVLGKLFDKRIGSEGLHWPEDITSAKYYMRFDFAPYKRTNPFVVDRLPWGLPIFLPMPENINDTTSLNYDTTDLGPTFGAKLPSDSNGMSALQLVKTMAVGAAPTVGQNIIKSIEAVTGAGAQERFGQEAGFIINPHSSVVFRGVALKSHTFSWKMAPKNASETNNIKMLLNHFKQNALPRRDVNDGFMGYPNLCAPHYLKNGKENEYIPIFGGPNNPTACAITNIGISYSPDGGSSFLRNGSPVAILLNLELREIEIKYNDEAAENFLARLDPFDPDE